jgi:hypothetical protein
MREHDGAPFIRRLQSFEPGGGIHELDESYVALSGAAM